MKFVLCGVFGNFCVYGLEYLPLDGLQQQHRQSQIDFPKLYRQQHGQHKHEIIEDKIIKATTPQIRRNHHVNLHSGITETKDNLIKNSYFLRTVFRKSHMT